MRMERGRRCAVVSFLAVLLFSSAAVSSTEDVIVGLLTIGDLQTTSQSEEVDVFSRLMYHGAQLAIQAVNDRRVTTGSLQSPISGVVNGSFVLQVPQVSGSSAQELADGGNSLIGDRNASVILGPFSLEAHDSIGFLTTAFGLPLVTVAYSEGDLPFTQRSSLVAATAVRAWAQSSQVQLALQAVLQQFNWTKVGILMEEESPWALLATELTSNEEVLGINYTQFKVVEGGSLQSQLTQLKACCRIVLYLNGTTISNTTGVMNYVHWWNSLRTFLLAARSLDMTGGDYVFLTAMMNPLGAPDLVKEFGGEGTVGTVLHEAFRSLLVVTVDAHGGGASTENFISEVERSAYGVGNLQAGYQQNLYATAMLHDAIWMYAAAAALAITAGDSVQNAMDYTPSVNFTGLTGPVLMNADRQRVPQFRVLGVGPTSSTFSLVMQLTHNDTFPSGYNAEPQPFVWASGLMTPPPAFPPCGFLNELCPVPLGPSAIALSLPFLLLVLAILAVVLVLAILLYKRSQYNKELHAMPWNILIEDIDFAVRDPLTLKRSHAYGYIPSSHRNSKAGLIADQGNTLMRLELMGMDSQLGLGFFNSVPAKYQNLVVILEPVFKRNLQLVKEQLVELKQMHDLSSRHLAKFIGVAIDTNIVYIVHEEYPMGSLHQLLHDKTKKLDNSFQYSFALDIIKGLHAIHSCFLGSHGNLKSTECYVDSHWVVHVSGMGLSFLKSNQYYFTEPSGEDLFWTAPELLRNKARQPRGTQAGDLYSYAMILVEIFTRRKLYSEQNKDPQLIVQQLRVGTYPVLRPQVTIDNCNTSWLDCIEACWNEVSLQRPSATAVKRTVKKLSKLRQGNIADHLLGLMEKYASNLEETIQEQTLCLAVEKDRTETLLYRLLPRQVANQLKQGETVAAEHFPLVTVYFSDIVGFTNICSQSTPFQVVDMLNQVYTMYDTIIARYNIYKVETIGDAYMLVSGLPQRNGTRHVVEICDAALDILHTTKQFNIPHLPDTQIKIRIGIHSGPCLAGVVGQTMPRYCLFGDTIVLASKMESSGTAQKIQISEATKDLLDIYKEYDTSLRGVSEFKHQTVLTTYWLDRKRKGLHSLYTRAVNVVDSMALSSNGDHWGVPQVDPIGDPTPTSSYSSIPGTINEHLSSSILFPPIRVTLPPKAPSRNKEHFSALYDRFP